MKNPPLSRLTTGQLVALSLPAVPMFALMLPMVVFLPPFFANEMGMALGVVGVIFLLGRIWDVLTDPIAGRLMDRLRHRVARHVWLAIGMPIMLFACVMIFFVQAPVSESFLMVWLLILYSGWTLMGISLFTWGSELSDDYHERSRIMAGIQVATTFGMISIVAVAAVIELRMGDDANIAQLRIQAMGVLILVTMPILVGWALWKAPKIPFARNPSVPRTGEWRAILANKPFMRLLLADLLFGLSMGSIAASAIFIIEVVFAQQGSAGQAQLLTFFAALLTIPLWTRLARSIDKHRAWCVASILSACGVVGLLFVPPERPELVLPLWGLLGLGLGAGQFLPRAILSDIVDLDGRVTGERRAGLFFALITTTLKLGMALSVAIVFFLLELIGFDPQIENPQATLSMVVQVIVALVALLNVGVFLLMWQFPINQQELARGPHAST